MNKKSIRYALGYAALLLASNTFAQSNYAIGPVESANSRSEVVVLGQRFFLDASTRCKIRGQVVSAQRCALAIARDTYVAVQGDAVKLDRAEAIAVLSFSYVPGASDVMVGARVTSVAPEIGVVRLGGLSIDATSLLSTGSISIE